MQCKSLWIKASAKCINVNVSNSKLFTYFFTNWVLLFVCLEPLILSYTPNYAVLLCHTLGYLNYNHSLNQIQRLQLSTSFKPLKCTSSLTGRLMSAQFPPAPTLVYLTNLINCFMEHDANVSSNAPAKQVQFVFIMHFVIILHVRSQENVCCIYLEILLIIVG